MPSPQPTHQYAHRKLASSFEQFHDAELILQESDVRMADGHRYRTPDLVVLTEPHWRRPIPAEKVLLVAEVTSPGGDERLQKLQAYADAGIPWYLLLDPSSPDDPDPDEPVAYGAELLQLHQGTYALARKAPPGGILRLPQPWNADLDLSRLAPTSRSST